MNLLKLGKGMVMEMSNRKRSKSESKTGGKKEKGTMRVACFLPNMWQLLHQLQHTQVKQTGIELTNQSTVKGKRLMFSKDNTQNIIIIDTIINEFEPDDLANVNIKVIKEGEVKDKTELKLTEFAVTDSKEKWIQLKLIIPRSYWMCC